MGCCISDTSSNLQNELDISHETSLDDLFLKLNSHSFTKHPWKFENLVKHSSKGLCFYSVTKFATRYRPNLYDILLQ